MTKELMLKIGLAALAYMSPLYEIFVVMMLFVFVDLVVGLFASNKRNVPRSSRRLRKSMGKLLCYLSVLSLSFMAEQAFKVEWFAAHRAVGAFICAVEFISILENMAIITGNPIFLKIVKWIRGKATDKNNLINEMLNEKNN